jgi:hypothetical protein
LLCRTIVIVILERLQVTSEELRARTGWDLKPEGLCKADRCVPVDGDALDARVLSERLGMALEHDQAHDVWALGPESGGHALLSAELPEITLPDRHGNPFNLASLHGKQVLLVAWASW